LALLYIFINSGPENRNIFTYSVLAIERKIYIFKAFKVWLFFPKAFKGLKIRPRPA